MPTVVMSEALLDRLTDEELEDQLIGSGKPPGVQYVIMGERVTWEDAPSAAAEVGTVAIEVIEEEAPEVIEEDESEPVEINLEAMTKEQIERHVLSKHGVNLNTSMLKKTMIKAAHKLDKKNAASS
jgi:hypothetical protein|tara:strand:+ start:46 stop:423 length:378 start_codon:yes stop_codon:yes gene_type:complete